jgi:putative membrane protein
MATWKKILLGSTLAVLMDTLIEPVAMQYDFWSWNSNQIPIQNYIGWFATSLIMFRLYYLFKAKADNRLALGYYFIQLFFFLSLFLFVR